MPLIKTIDEDNFRCCIWRVTESMDELYASLPDSVRQTYRDEAQKKFTSEHRKLEFVAVRALLQQMWPDAPVVAYHESGKPYLKDSDVYLSVSHTANVVAVALSCNEVGIDVERYGEKICRVAPRFLNKNERADGVWQKLLLWSAKETVYKMMNCREVDFREHLCSSGLRLGDENQVVGRCGCFKMHTCHSAHCHTYQVRFEIFPDFVLTYSSVSFDS